MTYDESDNESLGFIRRREFFDIYFSRRALMHGIS